MAALTGALAINDSLTRLDLRNNKVTATGAERLAAMLEKNTTLLALGELQAFPLSHPFHNCVACVDVCFQSLAARLPNFADLRWNVIPAAGVTTLAQACKPLCYITMPTIEISHTPCGRGLGGPRVITVRRNTTLTELRLTGNALSDDVISDIGNHSADAHAHTRACNRSLVVFSPQRWLQTDTFCAIRRGSQSRMPHLSCRSSFRPSLMPYESVPR